MPGSTCYFLMIEMKQTQRKRKPKTKDSAISVRAQVMLEERKQEWGEKEARPHWEHMEYFPSHYSDHWRSIALELLAKWEFLPLKERRVSYFRRVESPKEDVRSHGASTTT